MWIRASSSPARSACTACGISDLQCRLAHLTYVIGGISVGWLKNLVEMEAGLLRGSAVSSWISSVHTLFFISSSSFLRIVWRWRYSELGNLRAKLNARHFAETSRDIFISKPFCDVRCSENFYCILFFIFDLFLIILSQIASMFHHCCVCSSLYLSPIVNIFSRTMNKTSALHEWIIKVHQK